MKDHTQSAKAKVNALSQEALELQQQFDCAVNLANRHQALFLENGEDSERKEAMSWNAKAWKIAKRIVTVKENLHWEASALAQAQRFLLEGVDPEHEDAHVYQSNADYYGGMSTKAEAERDEYLEKRKAIFDNIKTLRTKAPCAARA